MTGVIVPHSQEANTIAFMLARGPGAGPTLLSGVIKLVTARFKLKGGFLDAEVLLRLGFVGRFGFEVVNEWRILGDGRPSDCISLSAMVFDSSDDSAEIYRNL